MKRRFLRQDTSRHSKLGKKRKKLLKWIKPKGRDSKMRLKRKSYPSPPSVGYKSPRKISGKIKGMTPVLIHNKLDLEKIGKKEIAILAKIGAKKKLEIISEAEKKKIEILNVGTNKNETGK
ncbi:50S ribosomal protein L32e [Candidatus Pacearchaeota archaeon]|nr:50S ribosomal protein L32e [Candidatus Pacearchaeota archaeon]